MIYKEDSLGFLADIPKSPRVTGWRSRERKKSNVNRFSLIHIADKRIQPTDLIPIRSDLACANKYLSAWNANLSAAEGERTRQVSLYVCLSVSLSVCETVSVFVCTSACLFA